MQYLRCNIYKVKNKIIMKRYYIGFVVVYLLVITSCGNNKVSETDAAHKHSSHEDEIVISEIQFKNSGIEVGAIETKKISTTIKANGTLDVPPQNLISISAPYGGFVKSTELLHGKFVKKGEVLAIMEHPDYIQLQQEYLETKSNLNFAKAEFERQQMLNKEEVNSTKTVQKAKTEFEVLQARYKGIQAKLELIHIDIKKLESGTIQKTIELRSPINGYVTQVYVNIGAFVNANTVLFEIVDTEHLHAEVSVFEKDINAIKVGQRVSVILANESKPRTAKVYLIGKEIAPDRTVKIHCHLDEEDTHLLPGMYLTAFIEAADENTQALPINGIVLFEGKSYVFELVNHTKGNYTFKRIEVQQGTTDKNYIAIQANEMLTNKKLVLQGAHALLAAMANTEDSGHGHAH